MQSGSFGYVHGRDLKRLPFSLDVPSDSSFLVTSSTFWFLSFSWLLLSHFLQSPFPSLLPQLLRTSTYTVPDFYMGDSDRCFSSNDVRPNHLSDPFSDHPHKSSLLPSLFKLEYSCLWKALHNQYSLWLYFPSTKPKEKKDETLCNFKKRGRHLY